MNSKALIVGAAGCAALCVYVLPGDATPQEKSVVEPAPVAARPVFTATPPPALPPVTIPDLDIDLDLGFDLTDDTIHGYAKSDDPADFAFMFRLDGVDYLRLSTEDRASRIGRPKLNAGEWDVSVVAPVDAAALPEKYRGWVGKELLVEGRCKARVTGFAEVSRVSGSPPYAEGQEDHPEEPKWTVDAARADNITLAARVEGCAQGGLWARAASAPAAPLAHDVEDSALAGSAKSDLLARKAPSEEDPIQKSWQEAGGEGDWRDAVQVTSQVFEHGSTGERWVIARALKEGGCGDPALDQAHVYRANDDGSLRRVATLSLGDNIHGLVDLDHDGQPELVLGQGDSGTLVDLAGSYHESISIAFHGCGC
jgi:hypothetical protein